MTTMYHPKTIFEPFKIHTIEPLPLPSRSERLQAIKKAHYNPFLLPADAVTFDLLTDSGTSAMSTAQWAAVMMGDESYAGSRSFKHFERVIQNLTGLNEVIPTHQGRAAEALLMKALVPPGMIVIGNTHFDTTRANIEYVGGQPLDLPCPEAFQTSLIAPFKGNMKIEDLDKTIKEQRAKIALIVMTLTNNSVGGQPVSLENIRQVSLRAKEAKIPFFIDAARFAENAYFIKLRESEFSSFSAEKIAKTFFALCDGVLMSAKKDAFGNIGGFLAMRDEELARKIRAQMVVTEGFPTYGGLAGRDLEALAVGLQEVLDENYLSYRLRSTAYFGEGIEKAGFSVVKPFGGHAIYIDAEKSLPQIPKAEYPGQSLAVALFETVGIRSVEVGSVMMGSRDSQTGQERLAPQELVRLALPRRAYTQSHVDYMIEMIQQLGKVCSQLKGYAFTYQEPVLRHFTARFRKIDE